MQAAHVRPSTLKGYTLTVRKYIIAPLGEMYLSEVTADDIKLAMVPVSKRSEDVYNKKIGHRSKPSNIKGFRVRYLFSEDLRI